MSDYLGNQVGGPLQSGERREPEPPDDETEDSPRAPAEAPLPSNEVRLRAIRARYDNERTVGDPDFAKCAIGDIGYLLSLVESKAPIPAGAAPPSAGPSPDTIVAILSEHRVLQHVSTRRMQHGEEYTVVVCGCLEEFLSNKGHYAHVASKLVRASPSLDTLRPGNLCPEHGEPLMLLCAKCIKVDEALARRVVELEAERAADPSPTAALREALEAVVACLPDSDDPDESFEWAWNELSDAAQERIKQARTIARVALTGGDR